MSVTIEIQTPDEPVRNVTFVEPAEFVIGRNPDCACCLKGDGLVSRKHAVLLIEPPSIMVKDLKSTNGVSVDGIKWGGLSGNPSGEPIPLAVGSMVNVGKTVIVVTAISDSSFIPRLTEAGAELATPFAGGQRIKPGMMPDLVGERALPQVPGYVIQKVVGKGGMGAVYLGVAEGTGEKAAIKLMTGAMALNQKMVEAFKREIEVTKTIQHSNIVRFFNAGITERNLLYLALEYVDGGDMARYMKTYPDRRVPLSEAYRFMLEVADGMAYAHNLGFIHRDMKPDNLLISGEGGDKHAKISDLGLAKNFEDAGLSGLTGSFTGGGTMAYMPPEQLTDFRDVKPSADIFSLAATFYEMLTGRIVYNFTRTGNTLKVVSNCDLVPLYENAGDVPPKLIAVLEKGLNANPQHRYAHAGEMLAALKEVSL